MKKGYTQIYTGNGKGKTTAALGQAIRAAGFGFKIGLIQFMKDFPYSELKALEHFPDQIFVRRFGNDNFVIRKQHPSNEDKSQARKGLQTAAAMMDSGQYDMVILDEICVAIHFKLISQEEVQELIKRKPDTVELVLTGRYCPPGIMEMADLVTEMREVRHYYQKGILARPGIES